MKKYITLRDKTKLKPVINNYIVEEEIEGYANELLQEHKTYIVDRMLRREIMKMSAIEIIS